VLHISTFYLLTYLLTPSSSLSISWHEPMYWYITVSTAGRMHPEVTNGMVRIVSKLVEPLVPQMTRKMSPPAVRLTEGHVHMEMESQVCRCIFTKPHAQRQKCVGRTEDKILKPGRSIAKHHRRLGHTSGFQAAISSISGEKRPKNL